MYIGRIARPPSSGEALWRWLRFRGPSPARLEPRVVHHGSPVTSRPGNHAEPHETSRPAQSLRCSWTVLTARENETNTSGFTTVLKVGAAGDFAQFQLAKRTHCMGSVTRQWNSPESLGGMSMRGAAGVGLPA